MNSWRVWSHRDGHGPDQVYKRSVLHILCFTHVALMLSNLRFERLTVFQWSCGIVLVAQKWCLKRKTSPFAVFKGKVLSCLYSTKLLEVMMRPPCNPVKHFHKHFQKFQIVWHALTCITCGKNTLCFVQASC